MYANGGAVAAISGVYVNRKTGNWRGGITKLEHPRRHGPGGDPPGGEDGSALARAGRDLGPGTGPGAASRLLGR